MGRCGVSESHPVYVSCASGNNTQTDVLVERRGDLVRLLGHPSMDFTGRDAYALAKAILAAIDPVERPWPTSDENDAKPRPVGAQNVGALIFSREMLMHYQCPACHGWWSIGDGRSYGGYFCPHCGSWLEIAR